jgi:hypothetical protein
MTQAGQMTSAVVCDPRLKDSASTKEGEPMSNFTDANPWQKAGRDSLEVKITIRLHQSGMARFYDPSGQDWPMADDNQVVGNVVELVAEGRKQLIASARTGASNGGKIKTLSRDDGWFDGYTTTTLRGWLRFWKNDEESKGRAMEMARENPEKFGSMEREDHIRMIELEISARESA